MKLPSYLVAFVLAFAAVVAPAATSRAEEATFDVFYTSLADEGDWYNTPDYGYVWQPYVAYQNDQWRPYTDGYWAQTDAGWTWVSYENFGWATYHYGRWTQLEGTGWVWVPGYEWGPGWVSWRQSDSYVGWAPIPPKSNKVAIQRLDVGVEAEPAPRAPAVVHEPRGAVDYNDLEDDYEVGYNASVDTAYDIGPAHYCFVPIASFGAPYVREVVLPPQENFVIIGNTYNCTNICYRRGPRDARFVYSGGPDFGFIASHVQRPIPRLILDRRTDIGLTSFRQNGFSPLSVVRGDRLQVVGPQIARREVRFNDVRPPRVRETIAQVRPINGWRGVQQNDPAAVQRLRAQFRQEAQVAPPAREVVSRLAAPAEFRPNAPIPAPLPPPPQARVVRERGPGGRPGNPAIPGQPGNGTLPGAAAIAPQPGRPTTPGGLQPVNPAGRGAQNAAEREARRNAQLQQVNERRAARGQPPLQPGGNGQPPQGPNSGAAAGNSQPGSPQTREQTRATRQQQQREAQQAAQQQRQQAAEQRREQQTQAVEQRRSEAAQATQERAGRQAERRGGQSPSAATGAGGPPDGARQQAAEGARARAERQQGEQNAATERAARQHEAQRQAESARDATRERASAAAEARQQQHQQQQAAAAEARRQASERGQAERQQQAGAAAERQHAAAEARQEQAAQGGAAAEARQQQAAQQRGAQQAEARAAAQQQQQQQQAAQRAQRQQSQQQQQAAKPQQQEPRQQGEGDKHRRQPEGQPPPQ